MTESEFLEELQHAVGRRSVSDALVDTMAFVTEVSERLTDDPVFGDFNLVEFQGTGKRSRQLRVHGYTDFDASDGTIGMVIGDWDHESPGQTLSSAITERLISCLEGFAEGVLSHDLSGSLVESSGAYDLAQTLLANQKRLQRIRLHVFSNRVLSNRFDAELNRDLCGFALEIHIWDLTRLRILFESGAEREKLTVRLTDFGIQGIPALPASSTTELRSYLCVIGGDVLSNLFERYGSRLLEGNVRSFLGMKSGVNKGIRSTIQDSPARFFAFNNGIAATAGNVEISEVGNQCLITGFTDFQIVNGGQTTASILDARKSSGLSLDGVHVQMKLTEVASGIAAELVPKIAEFANTQNKVSAADFFANHPFHVHIEGISRRLSPPAKAGDRITGKWFYERSRGQYQNEYLYLRATDKNRFQLEFPKERLITKTDLAKLDNIFNLHPHWACLGAQKSFIRFSQQFSLSKNAEDNESVSWDQQVAQFSDGYYKKIVAMAILAKRAEKLVSNATWYQQGYRAQIVAYGLSHMLFAINKAGWAINLDKLWNDQEGDILLDKIMEIFSENAMNILISPRGQTGNISEWAKREECWTAVKTSQIRGFDPSGLPRWLIPVADLKAQQKDEFKQGQQDLEINLQKRVIELSQSGYWRQLMSWPDLGAYASPGTVSLIRRASTIDGCLQLRRSDDFQKLLKSKEECESEGFRSK